MKFFVKMCISNIYISWFFEFFIAILTNQEINWAYRPERQIAPLSPIYMLYTYANVDESMRRVCW